MKFWTQICEQFPTINRDRAKAILISHIKSLPAIKEIATWSKYANIHLLSNHRLEWIQPIVKPIESYVSSITISSQVGYRKPNPEIYTLVKMQLSNESHVLFIDDQENNFKEARVLGWNVLLADENGDWLDRIMPLLSTTKP